MKYFFALGTNSTLSIAELTAVLNLSDKNNSEILPNNIFITNLEHGIDPTRLIYELGGTIKIGEIIGESGNNPETILKILCKILPEESAGKYKFGFSNYSFQNVNIKVLGMEFKKLLTEKKISARWVTGKEKILSSVIVEQNKLIQSGFEIVLLPGRDKLLIGRTQAVQPFKDLSFRDYGRPGRDDQSGMLPPKLAQIMINLSSPSPSQGEDGGEVGDALNKSRILLDPFCGSGTILTEAMLMGYQNLIGSDISQRAIEDSRKNVEWTTKNYELRITNYELYNKDVLELFKFIKGNSVDAVITEPYLGPQRGRVEFKKTICELENLYSKSLMEFYKILKPKGRVVMVWPIFNSQNAQRSIQNFLNINTDFFKIINMIPKALRNNKFIKLTNRDTIIYGRDGQKVWREIVVLAKI